MKNLTSLILAVLITAAPVPTLAQEESIDDLLGGFEEEEEIGSTDKQAKQAKSEKKAEPVWELSGAATLSTSYNYAHKKPATGQTDYRGLSRMRAELQLDLDVELPSNWKLFASGRGFHDFVYTINGRDNYTDDTLEKYENELELRDVYLQGSLTKSLDLKAGRQVVVWGKSDSIRVTDVLNPLDNREPGMVDIEDLRLSVLMTRLDYYIGNWNLTAIAIHETRLPKNPTFGSEFYPFSFTPPSVDPPPDNSEFALALNGVFSGWDVSFYYAQIYDDTPHMERNPTPAVLVQRFSRLNMFGAAVNVARGNWLLKAEAARFDGLEFFAQQGVKKSRVDILGGVEYSGFTETTISLEAVNRRIEGYNRLLKNSPDLKDENEFATALRFTRNFINQTLHFTALLLTFGEKGEKGAIQRVSLKYDVTDDYSVNGGLVAYQPGAGIPFGQLDDNDRLFLDIKYSF